MCVCEDHLNNIINSSGSVWKFLYLPITFSLYETKPLSYPLSSPPLTFTIKEPGESHAQNVAPWHTNDLNKGWTVIRYGSRLTLIWKREHDPLSVPCHPIISLWRRVWGKLPLDDLPWDSSRPLSSFKLQQYSFYKLSWTVYDLLEMSKWCIFPFSSSPVCKALNQVVLVGYDIM